MKIEPLENETLEEYKKRVHNRAGKGNKHNITVSSADLYKQSEIAKRYNLSFTVWREIIEKLCLSLSERLAIGLLIKLTCIGSLSHETNKAATKRKTNHKGDVWYRDRRMINFDIHDENVFNSSKDKNYVKENFKKTDMSVYMVYKHKGSGLRNVRFIGLKYVTRMIKNNLYGYSYKVYNYKKK